MQRIAQWLTGTATEVWTDLQPWTARLEVDGSCELHT